MEGTEEDISAVSRGGPWVPRGKSNAWISQPTWKVIKTTSDGTKSVKIRNRIKEQKNSEAQKAEEKRKS